MAENNPLPATITARPVAAGAGWRLSEFTCRAGPQDVAFEERHDDVSIAAVLAGSFSYAADTGRALLHPGALMLGNAGACYRCGHDHAGGDRCLALHLAPAFFAEIAASAAGSARFRFPVAMLPARRDLAAPLLALLAAAEDCRPGETAGAGEAALIQATETLLGLLSGQGAAPGRSSTGLAPQARDRRRIGRVLNHIEENAAGPLGLEDMAGIAGMSKYHFLRCFRQIVGLAPYDYLLGLRLRRAALRLYRETTPVAVIAYDCGFGDLSTFNAQFKATFGASPSRFRARHRAGAVA